MVDPDVHPDVEAYARDNGLGSANQLLTVLSVELAKAKKKGLNLWHVVGRIAADDDTPPQRVTIEPRGAVALTR